MLIKIRKLLITSDGYNRKIELKDVYLNKMNILSATDYDGINDFLLRENLSYSEDKFSLIKFNEGPEISEIIAHGSVENIFGISKQKSKKKILSD